MLLYVISKGCTSSEIVLQCIEMNFARYWNAVNSNELCGGKSLEGEKKAKISLIASMAIFGTIGIFRKYIPLSSGMIACIRGILGVAFLVGLTKVRGLKMNRETAKSNLGLLLLSGGLIGLNWVLLFESYRYTSVAVATLCYYMAPVFVMLASPFFLKETLTAKKAVCILTALLGMVFVSGVLEDGISNISEIRGILFGLGAAALYASVVLMNQRLTRVPVYDKTILQLLAAAITLLPYVLITGGVPSTKMSLTSLILLLVVGVVHTGIAYALFFASMGELKAQTVALFSYIDPIVAIILSAVILREPMSGYCMIGAALVLGAAIFSELPEKKNYGQK